MLVVPCVEGRFETAGVCVQASLYGSIFPAVWSFMLALRARGLGACLTTDHLFFEREAAEIKRLPARERTYWERWGERP